jgi:hypothetical protein
VAPDAIYRRGILSEPLDLDAPRRRGPNAWPKRPATPGLEVEVRGTSLRGVLVSYRQGFVTVRDAAGRDHRVRLRDGAFNVAGTQTTLVPPKGQGDGGRAGAGPAGADRTASGSVAVPNAPARVAQASRLLVEGAHDAELVERVWGDDLRVEGVVVELLDGADNLAEAVRSFGPRPGRRLGILLDHLVEGSKESRLAAAVDHPDVLVCGHPFVDVWAAIRPAAVGIARWPDVPRGQPWKEGVCRALGVPPADAPRFWKQLLGRVTSYADLEPALVGAVEQLIDFVTAPAG